MISSPLVLVLHNFSFLVGPFFFALGDEAVGHHPNNIEVLPIICFRGHGQSSHTIEIIF